MVVPVRCDTHSSICIHVATNIHIHIHTPTHLNQSTYHIRYIHSLFNINNITFPLYQFYVHSSFVILFLIIKNKNYTKALSYIVHIVKIHIHVFNTLWMIEINHYHFWLLCRPILLFYNWGRHMSVITLFTSSYMWI